MNSTPSVFPRFRQLTPILLAFALFAAVSPRAWGQRATASVAGTITDTSDAAVPAATVLLRSVETGTERSVTTNELGYYVVPALPAGAYTITVTKEGFQKLSVSKFTLAVDQTATVNLALKVGVVADTVEVVGDAAAVDTRTASLNTVINQKQIADLPLNGRNVLQLMQLTPGTLGGAGGFNQSATRPETLQVSASGGRGNSTTFVLDGGLHEDPYTQVANVTPNPDAMQEFSFQTNNYSAKFGGRGGGVVNMVTKSGTNQLHGSLYEYVRNAGINGKNFFASTDDGLKRNQYGVSVGGPIVKNKTFFFFAWQGTQVRQRPPTSNTLVPTAEQRAGNFSALLPGTQLVDPTTKQPIPGNLIPASQLDPIAQRVLQTIPLPNQPNGLLFYTVASSTSDNQYVGRVDHQLTNNHRISGRYFFDGLNNPAIIDFKNRLTNAPDRYWASHNVNFTDTITVRPNLLTNTTLSYSRTYNLQTGQNFAGNKELGINVPIMSKGDTFRFSITNYFGNAVNALYRVARNQYNLQHSWTWIKGRHQLDFGPRRHSRPKHPRPGLQLRWHLDLGRTLLQQQPLGLPLRQSQCLCPDLTALQQPRPRPIRRVRPGQLQSQPPAHLEPRLALEPRSFSSRTNRLGRSRSLTRQPMRRA